MGDLVSWESAVRWYREQDGNEQAVRANYFDLPVLAAAQRFADSEEFLEMARLLGQAAGRRVLDLGAGHGVTSYAMARQGWKVVALEPDPSDEVGWGAIEKWSGETGLAVEIVRDPEPPLPLQDGSMDAVIARQVLHHLPDLGAGLRELHRILKPGGVVLTTRDHVADDETQLRQFLANHPLQHLYGGENAHPLKTYLENFCAAGFELLEVWGPLESILNYYPGTEADRRRKVAESLDARNSGVIAKWVTRLPFFRNRALRKLTGEDRSPGRIYSILARKPLSPRPPSGLRSRMTRWLGAPGGKVSGHGE